MAVTAAAQGAGSPACTALSTVLANVGTIAAVWATAQFVQYVEAVKVVAEKFPGRDAVAASTLFMDWDPAYNGLAATVTKVCS